MKFRYYITDTISGYVYGTNNPQQATNYAFNEDNYVVDVKDNTMLLYDTTTVFVEEAPEIDA